MHMPMKNGLAAMVDMAAHLVGQGGGPGRRRDLDRVLAPMHERYGSTRLFAALWNGAGLQGQCIPLPRPTPADLPFVLYAPEIGWCLVHSVGADGCWQALENNGDGSTFASLDDVECVSLPRRAVTSTAGRAAALDLATSAALAHKAVFIDAVMATALITTLAVATSLFSMQVYDRVIPNHGFNTLWVLTVGVAMSIALEFILKQVRSSTVDRTCNAIDEALSEWFFNRMLGIRMEARPASVGTLASQVKGFEMVRNVLTSTSLFVLTDVPFALLLVLMIGLIGGWLIVVPLIALPIALAAGLMFQRAIQRHARLNLSASNRKAGLLVEAADGIESLKANSGEWVILARWNRLVAEAGQSDQRIRQCSALSQNLTATLQQLSYVALVAVGALLVTDNQMTMGALMACSIISGRALMPIVQLPGVMVQWAQARAAMEGLDHIIALPNEADDAPEALAPTYIAGGLRFEATRFTYGTLNRISLELPRLEIKPGERIGLLGGIGSGKSTLLKLGSGMYRPTAGQILLGGIDLALIKPAVARELVGYLPQEARLFSGTLRENLVLGLQDPGEDAILEAALRTGLIDLVLSHPKGLALPLTEGGRGVSGGQKQLIAVTRLLLARPQILLLDEPTSAMDAETEARVVRLLREIAAEGVTLVAATHKTALLPLFDRLIVLHGGRIVLDAPREAALARMAASLQPALEEAVA
jgi:ATP-binding cassette subfamily C protein LapB